MPVVRKLNHDWEWVDAYVAPGGDGRHHNGAGFYDWDEFQVLRLKERRKGYARMIEDLASAQKELGKAGDREGAREVKELLRYWQQHEKASTFVIRWFEAGVGPHDFNNWPLELASFLDEEFHAYDAS